MISPLYGGGFSVALAQVSFVYCGVAAISHWCVPALILVESIQVSTTVERVSVGDSKVCNCAIPHPFRSMVDKRLCNAL